MPDNPNNHIRKMVLVRHGESLWNQQNLFTGWTDVDLSEHGIEEAHQAGRDLKENGFLFDKVYTSVLMRAIRTAWILLEEMGCMWLHLHRDWRLNERHYGALQGLNKAETARQYGDEQVRLWRRSYETRPPALEKNDPRHPAQDARYRNLDPTQLPATESLKDTEHRVMQCWKDSIAPDIRGGGHVLVVAHGNSLRALVKHLDGISDADIIELNIPTGIPLVYELDNNLNPVRRYYLQSPPTRQTEKESHDPAQP